jgi:CubicO group peptidase (beta-lactamase class C family)
VSRIASVTKPMGGALTLSLIQDGVLGLDDPIGRWLPEAANPRVLVSPDAPLDRTTEAVRPVTVRHLLTATSGWGAVLEPTPLQAAMMDRGVFPSPMTPAMSGDEFVARVAELPLAFQPGDGWLYDTGVDLLGVLRFYTAMADGGAPVLSADSVALLTADALTVEQRRQAAPIVGPGASWGTATAVDVEAAEPWMAPGRWGWTGGTGTTAHVDPVRGTVAVLLTQRAMTGPLDRFEDFWTAVSRAA